LHDFRLWPVGATLAVARAVERLFPTFARAQTRNVRPYRRADEGISPYGCNAGIAKTPSTASRSLSLNRRCAAEGGISKFLRPAEFGVDAVFRHEFVVGALLDDMFILHDGDVVGVFHG